MGMLQRKRLRGLMQRGWGLMGKSRGGGKAPAAPAPATPPVTVVFTHLGPAYVTVT